MINIYLGRENLDKDKFMFAQIADRLERGKRVILIVPDQYTLQAEKNAFNHLKMPGLMDLEALSFSRLATRVFAEVGGGLKQFINNYGKYMMISRILLSENENLKVFKNMEGSADFVEKMNNFIAEMKNHNISQEDLVRIIEEEGDDSLLSRKLEDIERIYGAYESQMGEDKIDTADYLTMFISKISSSKFIKNSEFWISGFDYLSPKNIDAVLEIAQASGTVNIILTGEPSNIFFESTNALAEKLRRLALERGLDAKINSIPGEYSRRTQGRKVLAHLEEQYCAMSPKVFPKMSDTQNQQTKSASSLNDIDSKLIGDEVTKTQIRTNIELIEAANFYAEAETAAVGIIKLVRDYGIRYRDILVICNDMDKRASVIKRVFSEYDLPIFVDQRRGIHHNPALEYITALLEIAAEGFRRELVFKLLKTGLTSVTTAEIEELENYAIKFKINGYKWKREFKLTGGEYSEEKLDELNLIREQVVDLISEFINAFKKKVDVRDKTEKLFDFLNEKAQLPRKINHYQQELEETGSLEYAEEMSQVWEVILQIFDQLVEILGDQVLTNEEYEIILKTGFESIQMGMLPPSIDQILLGTMQRTRTGNIKAVFILGTNDGILPLYSGEETLLNEDEREALYTKGKIIGRNDRQIMDEEQMAIYRNLSKPSHYLFMSYSASDTEGGELRPSIIFEKIKRIFPSYPVKKDILNRDSQDSIMELIQRPVSTLNHLTDAMREWVTGTLMPKVWKDVLHWFDENESQRMNTIIEGLNFRNRREKIDEKYVADLYKRSGTLQDGSIITSPSGLEAFSRCPFSFFVSRGIRLKESRIYELDSRNVGDVYHETLMQFSKSMCDDGLKPLDSNSKWNSMADAECEDTISHIYDQIEESYNQGLFKDSKYEQYRSQRFKRIITDVALEIKHQVQAGRIDEMFFETEFRRQAQFEPIVVKKDGKTIEVAGKIDRIDILNSDYAKIIDYKSGREKPEREDIESGWQLQLMVYLKAVTESSRHLKPAGVFYFNIPEAHLEASSKTADAIKEEMIDKLSSEYRMTGMVINDKSVVESITGELDSKTSKIISAKISKEDPSEATGAAVMDGDDFSAMQNTVSSLITELCEDMISGDIKVDPKESKKQNRTACTYCNYRGICGYDKFFGY
jgi:ATP-dependent helicase/nuclease subunit B